MFEYRISPKKFRRDQIKKIYAEYAGEPDRKGTTLDERIAQSVRKIEGNQNQSKMKSMYQYTAGRLLLDQGQRLQAGRRFRSAMAASPKNVRAWYGCGLFMLPVSLRHRVTI
jgi:Flp pilus assembly protein TadD